MWQGRRAKGGPGRTSVQGSTVAPTSNVYRSPRDLFLAQRFATHASPLVTIVYTHPADEELAAGVRDLPC